MPLIWLTPAATTASAVVPTLARSLMITVTWFEA